MAWIAIAFLMMAAVSGCGLADLGLWIGKWEDGGRSADFRLQRFVLTDTFAGGTFRIEGRYDIDPNKYPKQVDFNAERVTVTFSESGASVTLERAVSADTVRYWITRVDGAASQPEDKDALRILRALSLSLTESETVEGIYRIMTYGGTYLVLEMSLPGDERPGAFGEGYARRDY